MSKLKNIQKRIVDLNSELSELNKQEQAEKGNALIECRVCNKKTRVNKLTFIQEMYYVTPYSCSGGDYWQYSDVVGFWCYKCNGVTRTSTDDRLGTELGKNLLYLKEGFKRVINDYDRKFSDKNGDPVDLTVSGKRYVGNV